MRTRSPLCYLFCLILLTACTTISEVFNSSPIYVSDATIGSSSKASSTPFQPEVYTPQSTILPNSIPSSTPAGSIWISPAVPESLRQSALSSGWTPVASSDLAMSRLLVVIPESAIPSPQFAKWIYALVAPFPNVTDGVSLDDLKRAWAGEAVGPFAGRPIWMDESTLVAFSTLWGTPGEEAIRVAESDQLIDGTWENRPSWAIIPFEELEPRWKVLTIDNQSPIQKSFDSSNYPLVITFGLQCQETCLIPIPATNRDPLKLTTLVMTGVTALVRATAWTMEQKGISYPARDIAYWLQSADITHISNEIPFAENCPFPDRGLPRTGPFCSDPRYIALLDYVGADVIELTGNHFQDWGSEATLYTLDMYKQRGWPYFGGGADLEDSHKAITIENNGNRLAFIGCNSFGPNFAWATETRPGAAPCDDFSWMTSEIAHLRTEGYLVIATFQHSEYYSPEARPDQIRDFRLMADAGAVIVSGSQAHAPQVMEFYNDVFIHYGLGNLFFDQMTYILPDGETTTRTRQEFIDRHIFYDGRYISTELLTAQLEDFAKPRPMTSEERSDFLQSMFNASGW